MENTSVSVPGRICLFGEHQDYLKLPVITAAIDLRVNVSGEPRPDQKIHLQLPDIGSEEILYLPPGNEEMAYSRERDYFKSVFNVVKRQGVQFDHGYDCVVRGNIPINSGTSSSSALNVAWCRFLTEVGNKEDQKLKDPEFIAYLAYMAEVEEFGEPGGMMDHYATAVGGVLYIDFKDPVSVKPLNNRLGAFVLGDSREPKDTKKILAHVKLNVLSAVDAIRKKYHDFNLFDCGPREVIGFRDLLTKDQIYVLSGTLLNRDITEVAMLTLEDYELDHKEFGKLLSTHHEILDKKCGISTPKINLMLEKAIKAGAYGGKINGSGGGGCMFAYAPENPEQVAMAIEEAGGTAYIINVGEGIQVS